MPNLDYDSSKKVDISPEAKDALQAILCHCEKDDESARFIQLKEAKMLDYYWNGLQHIFWDSSLKDWRIPSEDQIKNVTGDDKYAYDVVINIFKAHGESIIAALSADLPYVGFMPENAKDALDLRTTKTASKLAKIIQEYNGSKILFIQALFTLFTSHFVACYNYYERDSKYGVAKVIKYKDEMVKTSPDTYMCPTCQKDYGEQPEVPVCIDCGSELQLVEGLQEKLPMPNGTIDVSKGMSCLEIFGLLDIKIPNRAKNQKAFGYLIKYTELHYAYVSTIFNEEVKSSDNERDSFERSLRYPSPNQEYLSGDDMQNDVTVKQAWFRPWQFNISGVDKKVLDELIKLFPTGCRYTCVGSKFLDVKEENLDDRWDITKGGPSRSATSIPMGLPLIPIQDLENTLESLSIETIERGISTTFVSPKVLDFEKFGETEVGVGQYFPAIPPAGKSMSEGFYETRSASLSKEVPEYKASLKMSAQFVTGDVPSVHGGEAQGGSKTFGEYVNSRNYALQRLSIPWQYISVWWGLVIYKSVLSYFRNQLEDDQFTVKNGSKFDTLWIRKADAQGKFKLLQPEVGTDFPVSIAQKRNMIMQLVELNNPEINAYLYSPTNTPILARIVGLDDFVDSREIQINKQFRELDTLVNSKPNVPKIPPEMEFTEAMPPQPTSSVQIEEIDNHEIHYETVVDYLSSDEGQDLKENNPEAYQNCLLHAKEHKAILDMEAMQQQMAQQPRPEMEPENAPS